MRSRGFFQQFLRNPGQTGAVFPSGTQLCRLLVRTAGVQDAEVILEFGTGTGVVTAEIIRLKSKTAHLIGIEINSKFAAATHRRFPQIDIVNDCASRAKAILRERGWDGCDCIVSGLPWATFPEALQDQLLDTALEVLRPGGCFVTFAYLHGVLLPAAKRFQAKLNERFPAVTMSPVVWANVPPARVYVATTTANRTGRSSRLQGTSARSPLEEALANV